MVTLTPNTFCKGLIFHVSHRKREEESQCLFLHFTLPWLPRVHFSGPRLHTYHIERLDIRRKQWIYKIEGNSLSCPSLGFHKLCEFTFTREPSARNEFSPLVYLDWSSPFLKTIHSQDRSPLKLPFRYEAKPASLSLHSQLSRLIRFSVLNRSKSNPRETIQLKRDLMCLLMSH